MAEKRSSSTTTELINTRFYENQKRQSLTPELLQGTGAVEDFSSVTTSCDTGELNPPPNLGQGGSLSAAAAHHQSQTSAATAASISAPDKSRKGSVDQRIWNLVNLINGKKDDFFTTSSCSGRIILYTWDKEGQNKDAKTDTSKLKKGCKWLLVSHDEVQPEELVKAYMNSIDDGNEEDVYFKMEPCILHVQCRTLSSARKLIHLATESGFRNSGMVIGKENRITVAIRSAMGLEVPLPSLKAQENPFSLITKEYLEYLVTVGNAKMKENWSRNEKLTNFLSTMALNE